MSPRSSSAYESARAQGAQIAVFPELAVPGYPGRGSVDSARFPGGQRGGAAARGGGDRLGLRGGRGVRRRRGVDRLRGRGSIGQRRGGVLLGVEVVGKYVKQRLPNYGPFDEARHFDVGESRPAAVRDRWDVRVGLSICEDIWYPGRARRCSRRCGVPRSC
jgi:NAD+ synthase (glutamine-hydrolysing)